MISTATPATIKAIPPAVSVANSSNNAPKTISPAAIILLFFIPTHTMANHPQPAVPRIARSTGPLPCSDIGKPLNVGLRITGKSHSGAVSLVDELDRRPACKLQEDRFAALRVLDPPIRNHMPPDPQPGTEVDQWVGKQRSRIRFSRYRLPRLASPMYGAAVETQLKPSAADLQQDHIGFVRKLSVVPVLLAQQLLADLSPEIGGRTID